MGMFDTVHFSCPNPKCEGWIEMQSKAGDCSLTSYDENEIPVAIAADIEGEVGTCRECDEISYIHYVFGIRQVAPMKAIAYKY